MFLNKKIGLDLGTANTRIYLEKKGIVVRQPSLVAFNNLTQKIIGVGSEAKKLFSKTPSHITAVSPMKNGVISDFDLTKEMLKKFFNFLPFSFSTSAIAATPLGLTEVEEKSVEDLLKELGCSSIYFVSQPLAAALGSRIKLDQPEAYLFVDIGSGSTSIALLSANGIVRAKRIKKAGQSLNQDIIRFIKSEFNLFIGERTAEEVKIKIGEAIPLNQKLELNIRGKDVSTGLPKEVLVKDSHIRTAISQSLFNLVEEIKDLIESSPEEMVGDIYKNGVYFTGGTCLLRGIVDFFGKYLDLKVTIVDDPLGCLVRGTGLIAENFSKYKDLLKPSLKNEIKL